MFNQVVLCIDYCARFKRDLYIHTEASTFQDEFSRYFNFRLRPGFKVEGHLPDSLRAKIKFDLNDFTYCEVSRAFVSRESGKILRIDFRSDSKEMVLLHNACGGGQLGEHFLNWFTLVDEVREIVTGRVKALPRPYIGIHVRNTDYKTSFKPVIDGIHAKNSNQIPIYLATDSREVLDYAESIQMRHLNFSHVPRVEVSLHTSDKIPRFDAIIDQLADLFILACADQLHLSKMQQGSYSGYSILAAQAQRLLRSKKLALGIHHPAAS